MIAMVFYCLIKMIPERYNRSSLVEGYDHDAFSKLKAVVVGCGSLGNYVGLGLLGYCVKEIVLIDMDFVEESNLNRQLVFTNDDINKSKATALKERLEERLMEGEMIVTDMPETELTPENADFLIGDETDIVFLCVDNAQTRLEINDYCIEKGIPFIYGGTTGGHQGGVCTVIPKVTPCLRCWMKPANDRIRCSEEKDPSIIANSMLVSSLMLVEFQNLFMKRNIIPSYLNFVSGRRISTKEDVDALDISDIGSNENGIEDPDAECQPFYHVKVSVKKDCICQQ